MTRRDEQQPLTVAQIREVLAQLPDDLVLSWSDWDSDYDFTHIYGIAGIDAKGEIAPVITGGFSGFSENEEEDETMDENDQMLPVVTRVHSDVWNEDGVVTGFDEASGEIDWTGDKEGTPSRSPREDLEVIE